MMCGVCQSSGVKGFAILLDGSPPQHLNRCHSTPHALVPLTLSGLSNRMAARLALSVWVCRIYQNHSESASWLIISNYTASSWSWTVDVKSTQVRAVWPSRAPLPISMYFKLQAPRSKYISSWTSMAGATLVRGGAPLPKQAKSLPAKWLHLDLAMHSSIIVAKHCYTTEEPLVVDEYTFA